MRKDIAKIKSFMTKKKPLPTPNTSSPLQGETKTKDTQHKPQHPANPADIEAMYMGAPNTTSTRLHFVAKPKPINRYAQAGELVTLLAFILTISFTIGFITCESDAATTINHYGFCDFTGIILFSVMWCVLSPFLRVYALFTPTYRYLDNYEHGGKGMTSASTDVAAVANLAQAITESPCSVGISVICSHNTTSTESYTDGQGNRRTRTKTHTHFTFNHTYDFTAISSAIDNTLFRGSDVFDVVEHGSLGSQYLVFDSDIAITTEIHLAHFLETWRVHLHDANCYRDHTTRATLKINTAVPIVAEQMVEASSSQKQSTWCFCYKFMSLKAYWCSFLCGMNWLYVYSFERMIVRCELLYQKRIIFRPGMTSYSPYPAGGETLPMQVNINLNRSPNARNGNEPSAPPL